MVWRKLPILLNGIKPAMFFVMRVKQNEPESEKKRFPKNFFILQCKQHPRSTSTPSRSIKTDSDDEPAWFSVTTPLATLQRLRPCPLILAVDKSPKNLDILNCLYSL